MGCWNETCGITQMPIQSGDPVVLVFLTHTGINTQDHGGFCYSNTICSPKFLPVFGTYDDYGGIQEVEQNWNTQFIVEQLTQELAQVRLTRPAVPKPDPDDLHDDVTSEQLDLGDFSIEDVMDEIHQDSVWVPGVKGLLPVGWCMMHRWVWDHMTQTMERDWQPNLSLQQVIEHGESYYEAMLNKISHESEEASVLRVLLSYSRRDLVDWDNTFAGLGESGSQLDNYSVLTGIRSYNDVLWKMALSHKPVQDGQVHEVIRLLAQFLVFNRNMSVLRKFWSPQTGKGSQLGAHQAHLALHKLCVEKIQAVMAEYDDEDEGEQEEAQA